MSKIIQKTFKRFETKYFVTKKQADKFLELILNHVTEDEYGQYRIISMYFDTPDYRLIRNSIEGPRYKEKLRIRSYDIPEDDTPVFVEVKKKFKGETFKRRITLPYKEAMEFVSTGKINYPSQISEELKWFCNFYGNLSPKTIISYDRMAFFDKVDPELRITLDTNILWRTENLDLQSGVFGEKAIPENTFIMEIKVSSAMPIWLVHALEECKIYPASFSKYAYVYKYLLNNGSINYEHIV